MDVVTGGNQSSDVFRPGRDLPGDNPTLFRQAEVGKPFENPAQDSAHILFRWNLGASNSSLRNLLRDRGVTDKRDLMSSLQQSDRGRHERVHIAPCSPHGENQHLIHRAIPALIVAVCMAAIIPGEINFDPGAVISLTLLRPPRG